MKRLRTLKHLVIPAWWAHQGFDAGCRAAIETAIKDSEGRHQGELRFVAEGPLPLHAVIQGQTTRQRAEDLFAQLRVWDTEGNSGVLIYVQLLDHRVEILADRGIARRVDPDQWQSICRGMESAYAQGQWQAGTLAALTTVTEILEKAYPATPDNPNELGDRPVMM